MSSSGYSGENKAELKIESQHKLTFMKTDKGEKQAFLPEFPGKMMN